jgi:N-hydroxyarylamine O-acetyltransferase
MTKDEAAAYLARIAHTAPVAPDLATLRDLHRAHLHAVPFENLDIHLGRTIELDRAAFFRKLVGERRGGFCYELNGLFAELLSFVGFRVSLLSARVARAAGDFGPDFDHLALLVEGGDLAERQLADVGFGRSFREPLSLDTPREAEADGSFYRAIEAGAGWQVQSRREAGAWAPEYAFTLAPHPLEAFAAMCEHHQRSPESHFTQAVLCSLPTARGRRTLRGHTLIETEGEARRETELDEAARAAVLAERFGIQLPSPLLR